MLCRHCGNECGGIMPQDYLIIRITDHMTNRLEYDGIEIP